VDEIGGRRCIGRPNGFFNLGPYCFVHTDNRGTSASDSHASNAAFGCLAQAPCQFHRAQTVITAGLLSFPLLTTRWLIDGVVCLRTLEQILASGDAAESASAAGAGASTLAPPHHARTRSRAGSFARPPRLSMSGPNPLLAATAAAAGPEAASAPEGALSPPGAGPQRSVSANPIASSGRLPRKSLVPPPPAPSSGAAVVTAVTPPPASSDDDQLSPMTTSGGSGSSGFTSPPHRKSSADIGASSAAAAAAVASVTLTLTPPPAPSAHRGSVTSPPQPVPVPVTSPSAASKLHPALLPSSSKGFVTAPGSSVPLHPSVPRDRRSAPLYGLSKAPSAFGPGSSLTTAFHAGSLTAALSSGSLTPAGAAALTALLNAPAAEGGAAPTTGPGGHRLSVSSLSGVLPAAVNARVQSLLHDKEEDARTAAEIGEMILEV
jgi:hypothetical protein